MDRSTRTVQPGFATTFLDQKLQLTRELRAIKRAEFQNWLDNIQQTVDQIHQLIQFLRDNDLESQEQTNLGADRASLVEESANCADILIRRCQLISENTKPIVAVGEYNSMMGDCMQAVHCVRNSIREIAADEIHVIYV